ncbi:aminoglycoside phosphotransferase family protein [Glycomyces harbinensis]|uniref:Predicted kinase, aminoglycoside phosphotransferase (APT) family n=1 Tax=Glycomyces harbinensis TaxID=58114 RepID=A0A1G6RBW8_9ACTN|nr:aminoglycoside phosphotransferase family protein [Glycomyces harbinensis]SDD01903.1 Predicted kinase, aminoglycoside phosphotransferase (APT) family [Glycomyces harbinensis]
MPEITADLARRLVADQFPHWAHLPVAPVPRQGWDNRTFRLGTDLSVRLPSAAGYAAAVEEEDRCLPVLAEHLPIAIPEPVALGRPSPQYPHPWSVRRWLEGDTVEAAAGLDRVRLAADLGSVLTDLFEAPAGGGPAAGRHSFFRGCHPSVYGDEVQAALDVLDDVDADACRQVWAEACATVWGARPSWFHGDVSPGNLLVTGGRLSALIDFGTCGVGDPASDLQIAWTYFSGESRRRFREAVALTDDEWRRARGWALWKALITMAGVSGSDREGVQRRNLEQVLADPIV